MKSILFLKLITLLYNFQTFETPIWNGKQNNLTGPIITGSFEKRVPEPIRDLTYVNLPEHNGFYV